VLTTALGFTEITCHKLGLADNISVSTGHMGGSARKTVHAYESPGKNPWSTLNDCRAAWEEHNLISEYCR